MLCFKAVAKVNLTRVAFAQHELRRQEDALATEVFDAIDETGDGLVEFWELQHFLRLETRIVISEEDMSILHSHDIQVSSATRYKMVVLGFFICCCDAGFAPAPTPLKNTRPFTTLHHSPEYNQALRGTEFLHFEASAGGDDAHLEVDILGEMQARLNAGIKTSFSPRELAKFLRVTIFIVVHHNTRVPGRALGFASSLQAPTPKPPNFSSLLLLVVLLRQNIFLFPSPVSLSPRAPVLTVGRTRCTASCDRCSSRSSRPKPSVKQRRPPAPSPSRGAPRTTSRQAVPLAATPIVGGAAARGGGRALAHVRRQTLLLTSLATRCIYGARAVVWVVSPSLGTVVLVSTNPPTNQPTNRPTNQPPPCASCSADVW